jgi:tetrahydromethanopterin S-methyltransferase subunit F
MSITAPPQPNQDELEALIEEARERTRRRRLRNAVAGVAAAAIAVGVVSAFVVVGRGAGTDGAPKGFRLVHARGPVEHAQIEWYSTGQMEQRLVDISTGEQRRAPVVFDVWWDRGRDLFRATARVDGRVQSDVSGRPCQTGIGLGSGRKCLPPKPFDLRREGYAWPVDRSVARVVGKGVFRGRDVIWVQRLARVPNGLDGTKEPPVALDARTHRPVGTRSVFNGRVVDEQVYRFLGPVPADKVSFLVPDAKVPRQELSFFNSFPYGFFGPRVSAENSARASLRKARDVLGRSPLWLGPSFQGNPLRLVQTVIEGKWADGRVPGGSARAVILDYGIVMLEEFGRQRPSSEHGPRPGRLLVTGLPPVASLNRGGLLVHADLTQFANWHLDSRFEAQDGAKARAEALAVARGLRPLPPAVGDKLLKDVETPTASFVDPAGDAGRPPDIARVEVEPAPGDQLEFSFTVAGRRCVGFGGSGGPMIVIDGDQNPDTGSGYYGAEVAITTNNGYPQLLRAAGWDLKKAPPPRAAIPLAGPSGPYGSCEGKRFELYLPRKLIGVGPRGGFNFVVGGLRTGTDTVPDSGTFNYQQVRGAAPAKPGPDTRPPHVAAFYAERPGSRTVRLGYWVLDGRGAIGETFRVYRGRRLLATIQRPVRETKPFGFVYFDWRVPYGVHGPLRFTLRAVDAAGNRSTLSSATG